MSNKVKVTAYCSGIAKGDRKVKSHSFKLGYIDKEKTADLTEEEINKCITSAKVWANDKDHIKSFHSLKVKFIEVEIKRDSYGESESYMMFNKTDKEIVIQ